MSSTVTVPQRILAPRCGMRGCHATENPQGALDLASPDVIGRLSGVESATSVCSGRKLLVPGDPDASLLYDKLFDQTVCGARMPLSPTPLPNAEINEIRAWIDGMQ